MSALLGALGKLGMLARKDVTGGIQQARQGVTQNPFKWDGLPKKKNVELPNVPGGFTNYGPPL